MQEGPGGPLKEHVSVRAMKRKVWRTGNSPQEDHWRSRWDSEQWGGWYGLWTTVRLKRQWTKEGSGGLLEESLSQWAMRRMVRAMEDCENEEAVDGKGLEDYWRSRWVSDQWGGWYRVRTMEDCETEEVVDEGRSRGGGGGLGRWQHFHRSMMWWEWFQGHQAIIAKFPHESSPSRRQLTIVLGFLPRCPLRLLLFCTTQCGNVTWLRSKWLFSPFHTQHDIRKNENLKLEKVTMRAKSDNIGKLLRSFGKSTLVSLQTQKVVTPRKIWERGTQRQLPQNYSPQQGNTSHPHKHHFKSSRQYKPSIISWQLTSHGMLHKDSCAIF